MIEKDKTYFSFGITPMPGCCGMSVIYGVLFYALGVGGRTATKEEVYEEFYKKIVEKGTANRSGKLLLTDKVPPKNSKPDRLSIYDFCFNHPKVLHGSHCINPIHNSIICSFEIDITDSYEAEEVWKNIGYTPMNLAAAEK